MITMLNDFLTQDEAKGIRESLGEQEWKDGRDTAGPVARKVKNNRQIVRPQNPPLTQEVLFKAVQCSREFRLATYIRNASVPLFARYEPGMQYGPHVDDTLMNGLRADLAITVFLSSPEEYEGGFLSIHDKFGVDKIKGPAGSAIVYPASSIHEVTEVTQGIREVAIFWVQSMVTHDEQRTILQLLQKTSDALRMSDDPAVLEISRVHQGLLRMWVAI